VSLGILEKPGGCEVLQFFAVSAERRAWGDFVSLGLCCAVAGSVWEIALKWFKIESQGHVEKGTRIHLENLIDRKGPRRPGSSKRKDAVAAT